MVKARPRSAAKWSALLVPSDDRRLTFRLRWIPFINSEEYTAHLKWGACFYQTLINAIFYILNRYISEARVVPLQLEDAAFCTF